MPSAQIYEGITEGLANVQQYKREAPERDARRAEAQMRQEKSRLALEDYTQRAPNRASRAELELEQLKGELRLANTTRLGQDMFKSFDSYEADGDTKHLNNFLASAKTNPAGSAAWDEWARFDKLERNESTEAMLASAGISDVDGYFSDPELVKSKVVGTHLDGTQELFDMNAAYQGSGYLRFADSRVTSAQMERAKLEKLLQGTTTADSEMIGKILAENPGMKPLAAIKQYYAAKNTGKVSGSSIERTAAQLREENPNLSFEDSVAQASRLQAAPGGPEKNVQFTSQVRDRVHKAAGGDFYSADINDPKIRRKVGEQITALEQATKSSLTTEDRRLARKYRALTQLGGLVGDELSGEQTGLLDNMLHGFKQYMFNDVPGVDATSAYNTFRNLARNALMGATLTPAEIKSYDQAAGTLGNKLGPVLTKFKVQMEDVQARLQSIHDMNDPMIAQYYLGGDLEQIDTVIEGIGQRLDLLTPSSKDPETIKAQGVTVNITPDVPISPSGPTMTAAERWESFK